MYEQPYNPYRNNIAIIKDYFKSKSVLVLAILSIVSMILSVVNSLFSSTVTKEILLQMSNYIDTQFSFDASSKEAASQLSKALRDISASGSEVMSVLGSVSALSILTVVGLMLIYFKSRSENPDTAPSAGFTILYVVAVFSLVGAIMLTVGMVILAAVMFFLYAEFSRTGDLGTTFTYGGKTYAFTADLFLILAIVLTFLFVIIGFVTLFFTINHVRYLSSVRKSMNSVELSRKGAKPYGVFCVICAVSIGISMISSIPTLFIGNNTTLRELGIVITTDTTVSSIVSLVATAVSFVIYILQAKLALGYAKYIDDKKYGYNEPAAPAAYVPAGGATNNTQNPYSYLAQQKQEISMQEATFVNPYLNEESPQKSPEKPAATQPTCPACGAPVDPQAPFCGQCGTKL